MATRFFSPCREFRFSLLVEIFAFMEGLSIGRDEEGDLDLLVDDGGARE